MEAALVVLDGWGLADHDRLNAIEAAQTPIFDRCRANGAFGTLQASGRWVGLPAGGLGNSEVGHLTIGAGRIVEQAHTRINIAIENDQFRQRAAIEEVIDHVDSTDGRLHLIGLASDAGVHADIAHMEALIELAADEDISAITHAITDGRDTDPTVAKDYLEALDDVISEQGTGDIASVSGRYYAMDRDENWDRSKLAYDAIVNHRADYQASTPVAAVEAAYERDETDEFILPTVITGEPPMKAGDAVFITNFRADRMRQLVRMLTGTNPVWPFELNQPDMLVATMTQYDETFDIPVAFEQREAGQTLGERIAAAGKTQLRIAETEKYAHVTYFLNGGREVEFSGERREIIPSPDVPTYDECPEMSAPEVTNRAIDIINTDDPAVLVLNYANPDMVGHTGDYQAAIEAVEVVDAQLGRLVQSLENHSAQTIILADHGNAEDMGTAEEPHTAHTTNPVPFIYRSPTGTDGGFVVRTDGGLAGVAPTMLELIGISPPDQMTADSLLKKQSAE